MDRSIWAEEDVVGGLEILDSDQDEDWEDDLDDEDEDEEDWDDDDEDWEDDDEDDEDWDEESMHNKRHHRPNWH